MNTGKQTYWVSKGKHQAEYTRLINELMPAMGACSTLEGELLRAVSKLYYDYYNNGFCNNTSGPSNFLIEQAGKLNINIMSELTAIGKENNSGGYTYVVLETELETVVDRVVEYVVSCNSNYTEFSGDMWDYADDDYWDEEDEEDEEYDYHY